MRVMSPREVFGLGRGEPLDQLWAECAADVLGASQETLEREWRPIEEGDGTLYGRMSSSHNELVDTWHGDHNTKKLYADERMVWPFAATSVYQSSRSIMGAIKELHRAGARPRRVLDFGGGCGITSVLLAANFPAAEVHLVDAIPQHLSTLEWFKTRSGKRNVGWTDAPDGEYDLIVALECLYVFPHASQPGVGTLTPWWELLERHATEVGDVVEHTAWSAESRGYRTTGFFETYVVDHEFEPLTVPANKVRARFRDAMERRGYTMSWTGWNATPTLWGR